MWSGLRHVLADNRYNDSKGRERNRSVEQRQLVGPIWTNSQLRGTTNGSLLPQEWKHGAPGDDQPDGGVARKRLGGRRNEQKCIW